MKFLIKIEEAINRIILNLIEKMKLVTPHFFFATFKWLKNLPHTFKKIIQTKLTVLQPKVKILFSKIINYCGHYIIIIRGHFIALNLYLRSEEFKNANKLEMALAPIKKFKAAPLRALSVLIVMIFFGASSFVIYSNAEKIVVGTKKLRAPAASELEEPILEFKKLKYDILKKEIFLDVKIIAKSIEDRDKLISIEKEIEDLLLGLKFHITQLPLSHDEIIMIETEIFHKISGDKIKAVEIKQVLEARPKYFMQKEKMVSIKDLNLQLFLEDTRRNRQVWIDFTCLTSNRNIILFLNDHQVEARDFLNMYVEPVIPQLPIEEEGRQIIKDKIKLELNEFLKQNKIEGKILEIYVDYLMVS